mmetsp:Transcript_415/g.1417  ORF Transcript_415/g.1417 Transcript_415/m.1417 type:complete len:669 (+) Transcript_415:175-2181(+)|eukprot:CAMPEP_0198728108 /NCGR_PEP_ID=MMETSP1475-20131203/6853_1 /TAXON_ID= ORGANISM="Unidentified sp., Strain CCMP1999" /NCGR_SAMPLE_ID=MMETSP1475 /ASSEMBLY_ACC=CAM_ASM_001111 /LENGTH=668 /DNA_ID=CAMNT_0044490363 /DNA_START=143 /DNA_END=2149 /DNA_ORIENTATION=-
MGQVTSKRTFQPPPPTYANDNGTLLYIKNKTNGSAEAAKEPLVWMSNANGGEIPAVYLTSDWDATRKFTLIYSHAEAEDLGIAASEMSEVADYLGCDIFCYEYSGYGLSSQKDASEQNCYSDARAAYEYLVRDRAISPDKIILLGRGLGTGVSVDLASKVYVGGLVLISSFLSASYNHLVRRASFHKADAFNNVEKIRRVRCQVLVVHGMRDRIVPYNTVVTLFKRADNKAAPVIVPFADRNNIMGEHRYEVLPFVRRYLENIVPPLGERARTKRHMISDMAGRLGKPPASRARTNVSATELSPSNKSEYCRKSHRQTLAADAKSRESFGSMDSFILGPATHHSLEKARDKLWRLLGVEFDEESLGLSLSEMNIPSLKKCFVNEATQSERTKHMVAELSERFGGKISRTFLLQCLRAKRFDMRDAADVAGRYRKMMKSLGAHPKRNISIIDVDAEIKQGIFAAPGTIDFNGHLVLFMTPKNVSPKKSNWAPVLRALLYMLAYMHENEEAQIRGISVFMDLRGCAWSMQHRDFWKRIFKAILMYYPCRVNSLYVLDGSRIIPASLSISRMVGRYISRRGVVEVKLHTLARHIPRTEMPMALNGLRETDPVKFVEERRSKEEWMLANSLLLEKSISRLSFGKDAIRLKAASEAPPLRRKNDTHEIESCFK